MFTTLINLYNNYCKINEIFNIINIINNDEEINEDECDRLKDIIINGGCIYIKFTQWYLSNLKCEKNPNIEILIEKLDNFFNKCPEHDIEYTKELFMDELNIELDEYINVDSLELFASGSIGQVYKAIRKSDNKLIAIKVKHPDIDKNVEEFMSVVNFISFFQRFRFIRNRYNLCFDLNKFMDSILLQINFLNEGDNCDKFRELYQNNHYVYFPEIFENTENIIISEFIEVKEFNDFSEYKKSIIALNYTCFLYDMVLIKNFIHTDLHEKNWGIRTITVNNGENTKKIEQLVIFDCGICITSKNIEYNRELITAFESNKSENIVNALKNFINFKDEENGKEIMKKNWINIIGDNGVNTKDIFNLIINFMKDEDLILDYYLLNMIVLLILAEELLKKNNIICCNTKSGNKKTNLFYHIKKINLDVYTLSSEENSYNELAKYKKNILKNNKEAEDLFGHLNDEIKFLPIE